MKKAALALLLLALLAVPARAEEAALRLFTWADYVDLDGVIRPFEAETGVRVVYETFEDNAQMLGALASGGVYDVVIASDSALCAAREAGLMRRLDKSRIPNLKNIDTALLGGYYDPAGEYVVPYLVGGPLIVCDPARAGRGVAGFADLCAPSLRGGVGLIDDARVTVGMALLAVGERLNAADADALDRAAALLAALAPNVRALGYEELLDGLLSGELAAACLYTPFAALALEMNPGLAAVYPEEGLGFGVDGCFIPASAPHPETACAFLDFLLRPEIGARIARRHYACSPNVPARALLGDWHAGNPVLSALPARLGDAEFLLDLAPEAERRFEAVWEDFKRLL